MTATLLVQQVKIVERAVIIHIHCQTVAWISDKPGHAVKRL